MRVLGIDVGGQKIKYGILENKELVDFHEISWKPKKLEDFLKIIKKIIENYHSVDYVGVGLPGMIVNNTVHSPPNLPFLNGLNLQAELKDLVGNRVFVENDANLYALGEIEFGKATGATFGIFLTLGTGVGTAFFVDGKLLRGKTGRGAEGGHIIINFKGPKCNCGNKGCLEAYLGASHLIKRTNRMFKKNNSNLKVSTSEDIFHLAEKSFKEAIMVWEEYGYILGLGLTSLIHIFDPECIIIGGGLSKASKFFLRKTLDVVEKSVMDYKRRNINILVSDLQEKGAVLGAWKLVEEKLCSVPKQEGFWQ